MRARACPAIIRMDPASMLKVPRYCTNFARRRVTGNKEVCMIMLSIVVPVYSNERTIEALCSSLVYLYSKKYHLQIVLVNDGSRDESDRQCRSLHAAYPGVITYIKLSRNFGPHNTVMAGLHYATGEYCVIMDDDPQNLPTEVGRLVEEIVKGYDVVYVRYGFAGKGIFRGLGCRFNDAIAALVLKKPLNLTLSDFKIINRFMSGEITKYTGSSPYVDAIILRTTDNIGSILLPRLHAAKKKSDYTLSKLISLWGNTLLTYSLVPIRIIGMSGLSLMVFGVFYGMYKAYDEFHLSGRLTDFEMLMSASIFFRGMLMAAVGILGEYVGRIYLSLNSDPQFVIRHVVTESKNQSMPVLRDIKTRD